MTSLLIGSVIALLVILGISYYHRLSLKSWLVKQVISRLLIGPEMMELLSQPASCSSAKIVGRNILRIEYEHRGSTYHLHLPYNRRKSRHTKYLLIDSQNNVIDLNHHPQLPFQLTASELDGQYIRVVNELKGHDVLHEGDEPVINP